MEEKTPSVPVERKYCISKINLIIRRSDNNGKQSNKWISKTRHGRIETRQTDD